MYNGKCDRKRFSFWRGGRSTGAQRESIRKQYQGLNRNRRVADGGERLSPLARSVAATPQDPAAATPREGEGLNQLWLVRRQPIGQTVRTASGVRQWPVGIQSCVARNV